MEKQNNVLLSYTSVQVPEIYEHWKKSNMGSKSDFYSFMIHPSIERERFVTSLELHNELIGSFIATNLTIQ